MKKYVFVFSLIFISFASSVFAQSDKGATFVIQPFFENIKIAEVIDGRTFVSNERIRYHIWGIKAPDIETVYGPLSKAFLTKATEKASLRCRAKFVDNKGYAHMQCLVGNADLASLMVIKGYATDDLDKSGGFYNKEQREAAKAKAGIWKNTKRSF